MAKPGATDSQLAELARHGDQNAFELLTLKYHSRIMGVVRRYIDDAEEAQDVVQDVFVKAYMALSKFRGESAFYTWLYRIAVNASKNCLVKTKTGRGVPIVGMDIDEMENFSEALRSNASPEAEYSRDELQKALSDAIESLPKDLKFALTLRELDGFSYQEISEITSCPIGTVRSRIYRAREAVDIQIRPFLDT